MGGCTWCIALYRAAVGDERPTCLVCSGQHFLYEPHWAPGSTEAVQLGVTFANAMPARWDTEMPVLIRLLSGCADCGLPITGAGDERHNHCGPLPHTGPVGGPYCDRCR